MADRVKPIPDGYQAVTPYLSIKGAAEALDFYKKAFGAKETMRVSGPHGTIGHAEVEIGGSRVMFADEFPDMGFLSPKSIGGTSVHLHLYVENSDKTVEQAVDAGAKLLRPVADQFYGDRSGSVEDPFGHVWHIATRKENLSPEEIAQRAAAHAPAG